MMATCKALKLIVELDIHTVTCPGVWLPHKGEVLVRLWMLDATSRTTSILPVFPLVYHENFLFEKIFACQRLPELHAKLADETVRAELQQLRDGHVTPLANFECSLLTLLFPEVDRPGLQCTEQVTLCMQPLFLFPGVLPPKLEISTRTLIQEATRNTSRKSCIRKTISSQSGGTQSRSKRNVRQLARQAHSCRTPSPPGQERPPFVVRHVSEDIFKLPPPCRRRERARSPCNCDVTYLRSHREDAEDFRTRSSHLTACSGDEACRHECGRVCTVCKLYRAYFGTSYPAHESCAQHTAKVTFEQDLPSLEDEEPGCLCGKDQHDVHVSRDDRDTTCQCNAGVMCQCGKDEHRCNTGEHTCRCGGNEERQSEGEVLSQRCSYRCESDEPICEDRLCQCRDVDLSCRCQDHSLSGWCRRKRREARCPLLMDRVKDSY